MTTTADLLYVALFAVAWPLYDYFVLWPAFLRRLRGEPHGARLWVWAVTIGQQWLLVAAGVVLWLREDRPWAALGLSAPAGWRLGVSIGLVLLLAVFQART